MNVRQWISNHSKLAHGAVAVWGIATTLFATNPAFRAYVMKLYGQTNPKLHEIIAGIAVPLLLYWQSKRSATVTTTVNPGGSTTTASVTVVKESKDVQ